MNTVEEVSVSCVIIEDTVSKELYVKEVTRNFNNEILSVTYHAM